MLPTPHLADLLPFSLPRPRPMRSDHGLLAICLHANGANVIAVDRAAGPLEVARQNLGSYLRHAMGNANLMRETVDHAVQEIMCEGIPRLECRLGNGLSALEEGEVDTVCIAGVGESIPFCQSYKPRELYLAVRSLKEGRREVQGGRNTGVGGECCILDNFFLEVTSG